MAVSGRSGRGSWRLYTVALLLVLSTAGLLSRLAYLQLVRHADYVLEAQGEHLERKTIPAHRGNILDTNLNPLATSIDTFDVLVDRSAWKDPQTAASAAASLASILGHDATGIRAAVGSGAGDAVVAQGVDYATGRRIEATGIPGVITSATSQRIYPEGDLASPLLGFVGRDGSGLTGIERDYNAELTGKPGVIDFERDSLGNPIALGQSRDVPPQQGADVVLTIDRTLQSMAEQELDAGIARTHADGGDILIMDPSTGAILADASRPAFQLSKLDLTHADDQSLFRLRTVTDMYEPGSVFKLITMSAAINEGKVNPNTTYDDLGFVRVGGSQFHNWDYSTNGITTMTQVLVKSLNTGSIWVSQVLGKDLFYQYVRAFGFGAPTHVGLSGEAAGQFRTPDDPAWSPADLAANSFGQGLSATPLQVLTAVSTIANGGKLMQPYVVQSIHDTTGEHDTKPTVVREPITAKTAATMTDMMRQVLESNLLAKVPGYSAAGKSGTAYVPNAKLPAGKISDAYYSEITIPSYLGFAPLNHPRLAILVKLNDLGTADLGGELTAPIYSRLMHDALNYLHVPEDQPAGTH